jgi:hypothetical protein
MFKWWIHVRPDNAHQMYRYKDNASFYYKYNNYQGNNIFTMMHKIW